MGSTRPWRAMAQRPGRPRLSRPMSPARSDRMPTTTTASTSAPRLIATAVQGMLCSQSRITGVWTGVGVGVVSRLLQISSWVVRPFSRSFNGRSSSPSSGMVAAAASGRSSGASLAVGSNSTQP